MNFLKLIPAFLLLLSVSAVDASALQCRSLFDSRTNLITEVDIERKIEALAISYLQLSEAQPELKQQVIAHINKELTLLMQVNENSVRLFKQKISELSSRIADSRKSKEKEDEAKRKEREIIRESQDPENIVKKIFFHEISPGKFMMGSAGGRQFETEITKPFAMMQTQFTQIMWATLKIAMGEKDLNKINPSRFKSGSDSAEVIIEGIPVQMKPYHPVEMVNFEDITEFLIGLNKLSNSTDAKDQALLSRLIPNHKQGDSYNLPTDAQWEFVARDRGNFNKTHFDRNDGTELSNYAVYGQSFENGTSVVASKLPRVIEGHNFYDLEGNVAEWVKDLYGDLTGGPDPQGPSKGTYGILRGGSWNNKSISYLHSGFRGSIAQNSRLLDAGFRLVRTRP